MLGTQVGAGSVGTLFNAGYDYVADIPRVGVHDIFLVKTVLLTIIGA